MREKITEPFVVYRGSRRRLEVETKTAMFEFHITPEGLTSGDIFAQEGYDLENITPIHQGIALRLASEWLSVARKNNPAI